VTCEANEIALFIARMGRHRYEHDGGWDWSGVVDVAQLVIAGAAVAIAIAAFWLAWRANIRAGNRERLTWMHTALNQLTPLQDRALNRKETEYAELQQWLRTCLAVSGARERLPLTAALARRPMPQTSERDAMMVEAVEQARAELFEALEHDGNRASDGKRLE
jgi:hypothetical protein